MGAVCVSRTWATVGYQTAILLVTAVASGPAEVQGFHRDANLVALGPSPRIVDARLPPISSYPTSPPAGRDVDVAAVGRHSRRQCARLAEHPDVIVRSGARPKVIQDTGVRDRPSKRLSGRHERGSRDLDFAPNPSCMSSTSLTKPSTCWSRSTA